MNDELKGMCKEAFMGSFEVMSGIIREKRGGNHMKSLSGYLVSRMGSEPGSLWIQVG